MFIYWLNHASNSELEVSKIISESSESSHYTCTYKCCCHRQCRAFCSLAYDGQLIPITYSRLRVKCLQDGQIYRYIYINIRKFNVDLSITTLPSDFIPFFMENPLSHMAVFIGNSITIEITFMKLENWESCV